MKCYYCSEVLESENDHYEHIIPQAVGGRLTSRGILCEPCGRKLGKDIDKPFSESFTVINQFFDINRDRGKSRSPAIKIEVNGLIIEVKFSNNSLVPVKNYIDRKNKIIYTNLKEKEHTPEKLKYLLHNGESLESFNIKNKISATLYLNMIADSIENNEEKIKKGLLKIAVEYSLLKGISLDDLYLAFDKENKEYIDCAEIIHYFPLSEFEKEFDSILFHLGKDYFEFSSKKKSTAFFPYHMLKLFSYDNTLYCYINLYSYYECYVVLSREFYGDICYSYINTVCYILPDYYIYKDLYFLSPKDFDIAANHFNILHNELYEEAKNIHELHPDSSIEFIKKVEFKSKFDNVDEFLVPIMEKFLLCLEFISVGDTRYIPDNVKECFLHIDEVFSDKNLRIKFISNLILYIDFNNSFNFKFYKFKYMENFEGAELITPKELQSVQFKKGKKFYNSIVSEYRRKSLFRSLLSSDLLFKDYERIVPIDDERLHKTNIKNLYYNIIERSNN